MRVIYGDGPTPNDLMIVGERPGIEEHIAGIGFVGPAGQELWARIWKILRLGRDAFYVTNLVKTFTTAPPHRTEILRDAPLLNAELQRVQPKIIVTIGYHAARAFLPQFEGINGDYFHGLAFPFTYGRLHPRTATIVPVVHASAALRQPNRYQHQLTDDLRAVRRCLDGTQPPHRTVRPAPHRISLATFSKEGLSLGLDTEGTVAAPECVTLTANGRRVACVDVHDGKRPKFLKPAIEHAKRLYIHNAPHDWQILHTLGIRDLPRVDCTMLMAYLLELPQSLKVLAYRELGYVMSEYEDLVAPLDAQVVRATVREFYEAHRSRPDARTKRNSVDARRRQRECSTRKPDREEAASSPKVPTRALTSIKGILDKDADKSPRARWQSSKFSPLVQLPPAPTWKDLPESVRVDYAMVDAAAHLQVAERLLPRIKANGLSQIYEIDRSVLPFLVRMEHVGMACDADALRQLSQQFEREYEGICKAITVAARLAGLKVEGRIDPTQNEKVSELLFDTLGIEPTRMTPSGKHHTTQDKYLKARRGAHGVVDLILQGRQLSKYKGTYTDKLPTLLREGRYYPDWRYTRTATGRLAETIILLIPKHTENGKKIRNAFHATDGHRLVSVDLSQIELRVMAHLSHDRRLLDAYGRGEDIHARVAHDLLGAPRRKADQDESLHRLPAKTINFGIINGMTEFGMLDQLHEQGQLQWDIEQVREMLVGWFKIHVGVARFWESQKCHARKHGYVVGMFGRRRSVTGIWSADERIRKEAERQCLFAIQNGADDISKIWNRKIWKYVIMPRHVDGRRYCEPWVRVHDDTTLEVDARIARTVRQEMLGLVPQLLKIPTKAEGKIGERWGSLH